MASHSSFLDGMTCLTLAEAAKLSEGGFAAVSALGDQAQGLAAQSLTSPMLLVICLRPVRYFTPAPWRPLYRLVLMRDAHEQ